MVQLAMNQFVKKLEKDLKESLVRDKNSELNNIFQVYAKLDELDRGVQVYLDYLIGV